MKFIKASLIHFIWMTTTGTNGCDNDVCTGNHIRYIMFDTITAAADDDDDNNGGVGFENSGWQ